LLCANCVFFALIFVNLSSPVHCFDIVLILRVRIAGDWGPSLAFFDLRQKCPQHKTSAFRYEVNHCVSNAAAAADLSPSGLHLRFHHANRNRRPVQGTLSFSPIRFLCTKLQARAQFFWQATPVTIGTFSKWEDAVVSQLPSVLSDVSRFVIANGFRSFVFSICLIPHTICMSGMCMRARCCSLAVQDAGQLVIADCLWCHRRYSRFCSLSISGSDRSAKVYFVCGEETSVSSPCL
jgi:hypothetical protein